MENYFQVLGVHRGSNPDDIRASYRKLAMATHPDRVTGKEDEFTRYAIAKRTLLQDRPGYERRLAVLGTKCKPCGGTGTRSKAASWGAATLVACKECAGCGYVNLPKD